MASESEQRKGSYTWRIPNFLNQDKLYSPSFEIGTNIWRLLVFPKGREGFLAIYLDAPEASYIPANLSPSADFKLVIVNQVDPSKSHFKETSHTFNARESDWGFTNFIPMADLRSPKSPYVLPSDGTVELRVEVQVQGELTEQEEKQKEEMDARMYITVKVATDADIQEQLDSGTKVFDLVDHDLLAPERSFLRLHKLTKFSEVKRLMAERTGVPPEKQRYWAWGPRPNNAVRPVRTLTPEEETSQLLDLRDLRDMSKMTKHLDIRLYLEVPGVQGKLDPKAPLFHKTDKDILIFLKAYYPEQERIKYFGRQIVPKGTTVQDLVKLLQKKSKSGFGPLNKGTLEVWEEVKWSPSVVVELCDPTEQLGMKYTDTFMDGDIFIVQRSLNKMEADKLKNPSISSYFCYVRNRRLVNFKQFSDPKEEGFTLELLQDSPYSEVTLALARKLGQQPPEESAARIRLTCYNKNMHGPQCYPIKPHEHSQLKNMLPTQGSWSQQHLPGGAAASDILYYEVLDMEKLERLKTIKVYLHKDTPEQSCGRIEDVQRESNLLDILEQLEHADKQRILLLTEMQGSQLCKIDPKDFIINLHGTHWFLRAENIPRDELFLEGGEQVLHCYPISKSRIERGVPGIMEHLMELQQSMGQQLACKDQQLAQKDRLLSLKDQQLLSMDTQLAKKDKQLSDLRRSASNQQPASKDQQLASKKPLKTCVGCGKCAVNMQICSRCKRVYSCSNACFAAAWYSSHKYVCGKEQKGQDDGPVQ